MSLKLKNFHLDFLVGNKEMGRKAWLDSPLEDGKKVRSRNKFLKIVTDKLNERNEARVSLIKNLAEKDEAGEAKIITDEQGNQKYDLTPEKLEEFNKEYVKLMDEDVIFDIPESQVAMYQDMKEIVLEGKWVMQAGDGAVYDIMCEEFEKI